MRSHTCVSTFDKMILVVSPFLHSFKKIHCDQILENASFWHIGWSDVIIHISPSKKKIWCETSQQEGLIVALSKCAKKLDLKKTFIDFQSSLLKKFACAQKVDFPRSSYN